MTTTARIQPTTILCSECGVGTYHAAAGIYTHLMHGDRPWVCSECGHSIVPEWDIDLEADETMTTDESGALAYTTTD